MDFFEAQDEAQARTKSLVVYFVLAVIVMVAAVYFAVTAGVFYYDHKTQGPGTEWFSPPRLLWTLGVVVPVIVLASVWRITSLRGKGGAGVAEALGGRRITTATKRPREKQLMNVVEEMAIAAGMPVPDVYVLDDETRINAFAAGFSLDDAAVGVTRGALDQLDREELQGVIAHEFSHVLNGDMRLGTKLSGWIFGIVMLTMLGRGFWALIGGGGRRRRSRHRGAGAPVLVGGRGGGRGRGGGGALIIAIVIVAVLITVIGFIGEFFARLIQAAVSRQREYLADAAAVQFTRNPQGLGNALRRIGGGAGSKVGSPAASEFAHAFFSKSLRSEVAFLSTHPPLPKRIARILGDWDGGFLPPREESSSQSDSQKAKAESGGAAQSSPAASAGKGPGFPGGESFGRVLTAGIFMQAIGRLREDGRRFAEAARAELEERLPEVFEDADQSLVVLAALLLHSEGEARERQMALLQQSEDVDVKGVEDFAARMAGLTRSSRMVLLELLAPRLGDALAEVDRESFVELVEALVRADETVSPFELAGLVAVRRKLLGGDSAEVRKRPARKVVAAACVVASRLAQETESGRLSTEGVLAEAARQAPYFVNQLQLAESTSADELLQALDTLAVVPFGIRRQFLAVCERIIAADEKATRNEAELLRAVALALGAPVAPIFPEDAEVTAEP